MKRIISTGQLALLLLCFTALLQGCLKDTATKTYTLYTPIYKSTVEVRSNIKSNEALPIVKPGKLVVLGKYIFLNEVDKGVHIIDNTNPSAPINKYFIAIPGNIDLAIKGNTLYADLYKDLVTIDISNPSSIQLKNVTKDVFTTRNYPGFYNGDTSRVIVGWSQKDTTVSETSQQVYYNGGVVFSPNVLYSLSAAPSPIGVNGSMARFALLNNYLYTVDLSRLNVFDISQSENPTLASQKNIGWEIETIFPFKGNLFIGSQAGVYIYSTANPAQPSQVSMFAHLTSCDPVIADGNFAYVTLHDGTTCHGTLNELDVLDITDLSSPTFFETYKLTSPHGLSKDGNNLFICDGSDGLKVFDATNPHSIKLTSTVSGIEAYDVIAMNNNAIVVTKDGLYQFDYSDTKQISRRSKLSF